ncbi:DUF6276 family protein [Halogeometricum luteum]|uniref:DUF6276 family protein n=1 Tax=Halogeometricum luteum TaxID=2950537 RepID=A0ABU2G6R4_9EURY|nr:DUF6276 family protein [Halogeometricum sp. S3BR5-2]MDS0296478.1 DUF6276 family protein [Halogeometricum sp. S3BR5-2]
MATCSVCDEPLARARVPTDLREYVDGAPGVGLCPVCLRTDPVADPPDADEFDAVGEYFPRGDGGVVVALALGMLDSLALNRPAVQSLVERAEREGADVLLTLDRLAEDGSLDPHFDVERRRAQVEGFL